MYTRCELSELTSTTVRVC